jgi:shikimate dehydrogenase
LLAHVRAGDLHGLNVTIPHKQNVIPFLDVLTPAASAIGAVNTVFRKGEDLVGDNTDAPGFWADLRKRLDIQDYETPDAVLLGAGGSARAVAYALLTHGFHLTIVARRVEQARELQTQFSIMSECISICALDNEFSKISADPFSFSGQSSREDLRSLTELRPALIVNATPVGMHPITDDSPWPDGIPLPGGAAIYDLVYNPFETLLMKRARAAGLPAVPGLGMLVEQAALAFELWTGQVAPREVMMEAAMDRKTGV